MAEKVFGLPREIEALLNERDRVVSFTGHRQLPLQEIPLLREKVETAVQALLKRGYVLFLTGGALGFDTLAQEVLLSLKPRYPAIIAVMVLPCADQSRLWSPRDKERYGELVRSADGCICLEREYTPDCMQKRNRFMVDHSRITVAYYDGHSRSGTGSTVRYGAQKGNEIHNLHPAAPLSPLLTNSTQE